MEISCFPHTFLPPSLAAESGLCSWISNFRNFQGKKSFSVCCCLWKGTSFPEFTNTAIALSESKTHTWLSAAWRLLRARASRLEKARTKYKTNGQETGIHEINLLLGSHVLPRSPLLLWSVVGGNGHLWGGIQQTCPGIYWGWDELPCTGANFFPVF